MALQASFPDVGDVEARLTGANNTVQLSKDHNKCGSILLSHVRVRSCCQIDMKTWKIFAAKQMRKESAVLLDLIIKILCAQTPRCVFHQRQFQIQVKFSLRNFGLRSSEAERQIPQAQNKSQARPWTLAWPIGIRNSESSQFLVIFQIDGDLYNLFDLRPPLSASASRSPCLKTSCFCASGNCRNALAMRRVSLNGSPQICPRQTKH